MEQGKEELLERIRGAEWHEVPELVRDAAEELKGDREITRSVRQRETSCLRCARCAKLRCRSKAAQTRNEAHVKHTSNTNNN